MDELFVGDTIAMSRIATYLRAVADVIADLTKILGTMRDGCDPEGLNVLGVKISSLWKLHRRTHTKPVLHIRLQPIDREGPTADRPNGA
ncbi:hypothetical protein BKA93DRAFT_830796 [Sparassis latifolia]